MTDDDGDPRPSSVEVVKGRWKWIPRIPITVEPILFGFIFAVAFTENVSTSALETKICMEVLNQTRESCSGKLNSTLEDLIQPQVARLNMAKSLIECIIPAILSFFIGPWSDSNGRKPFLLLPLLGAMVYHLSWAGLVFYMEEISPLAFLLPSFAPSLAGGLVSIFCGVYSYLGDVTTDKNRSIRVTWLQCAMMMAFMLGNLLISKLMDSVKQNAAVYGFLVGAGVCFLSFLYCLMFLKETVIPQGQRTKLFTLSHVKEMWQCISTPRHNHGRTVVFLLTAMICLIIFVINGESSVKYLSLREKFSISLVEYSRYIVINSFLAVVSSLAGVWLLQKVSKSSEVYLLLIILILNIISSVFLTFPRSVVWFMIFLNLSCFTALLISLLRSEIMRTVPKNELGKVFGFVACMEALAPLPAAPLYTSVYVALLPSAPFCVYFLTTAVWVISLGCLSVIILLQIFVGAPYYTQLDSTEPNSTEDEVPVHINT